MKIHRKIMINTGLYLLRKAKYTNESSGLIVKEVEPASDNTGVALGITKERQTAIGKVLEELYGKATSTSAFLAEFSKHCIHPNELAWACYMIGSYEQVKRDPMAALLAAFSKKLKPE